MITSENWSKAVERFKRGGFDKELAEKVAVQAGNVKPDDFRFLATFGFETTKVAIDTPDLNEAQKQAQTAREMAEVNEAKVLLHNECNRFRKHKELATFIESNTLIAVAKHRQEQSLKNEALLNQECQLRFPTRELDQPHHVLPFVNSAIQHWVLNTEHQANDVYVFWYANLMVCGSKCVAAAPSIIQRISDCISNNPQKVAALLVGPNCGTRGEGNSDEAITKAEDEIAAALQEEDLRLKCVRVCLSMNEDHLCARAERPGFHMAWYLMSDNENAGALLSEWAKSLFYKRRGTGNLIAAPLADYVLPTSRLNKANFDPRKDTSPSVRRKQWLSGHAFFTQLRDRITAGMNFMNASKLVWVDALGCEGSLAESVMRHAFAIGNRNPQQIAISLAFAKTDCPEPDAASLIANFVSSANTRVLDELLREKTYFIDNWEEAPVQNLQTVPALQESDYKATFPAAAQNVLPLRADWLSLVKAKLSDPNAVEAIDQVIKDICCDLLND